MLSARVSVRVWTRCSRTSVCPYDSSHRSSADRALMIGPMPNHHSAPVTTSRKSSTATRDSAKPTVAETSNHARSRQVIGSDAQPTIFWTRPPGASR